MQAKIPPPPRMRIGYLQGGFMIGIAFCVDMTQLVLQLLAAAAFLVPVVGQAVAGLILVIISGVTFVVSLWFFLWLKINNVSFLGGRQALIRFITLVAIGGLEILPGISILPAWTIGMTILILLVRSSDKKKIAEYRKKYPEEKKRVSRELQGAAQERNVYGRPANDNWQEQQALAA